MRYEGIEVSSVGGRVLWDLYQVLEGMGDQGLFLATVLVRSGYGAEISQSAIYVETPYTPVAILTAVGHIQSLAPAGFRFGFSDCGGRIGWRAE